MGLCISAHSSRDIDSFSRMFGWQTSLEERECLPSMGKKVVFFLIYIDKDNICQQGEG